MLCESVDIDLSRRQSISVIIPIFNSVKYLEECLSSVSSQTLSNIEILLVIDGNSDSSNDIVQRYCSQEARARVLVNDNNMGAAFSRNRGIEMSKGDYIAFLDADDKYPTRDSLEILYREALRTHMQIVGGSLYTIDSYSLARDKNIKGQVFAKNEEMSYRQYQFDGGFYRFIYSRHLLNNEKIKFPCLRRFQDPIFLIRALEAVRVFRVIPNYVYAYRKYHKAILWSRKTFIDHIAGVLFLLSKSSNNKYSNLHFLMIRNLARSIMLKSKNFRLIELLSITMHSCKRINVRLLKEEYSYAIIVKTLVMLAISPVASCIFWRFK